MSFAGIILLVIVLIVTGALAGATGRRLGIVAGIAGLGFVALTILFGVMYLSREAAMPHQAPPASVMWSEPHAAMSVSWQEDAFHGMTANEMHAQWRRPAWSFVGLMLLAGIALAVFALLRRAGGACAAGSHPIWWPATLLLLLLPLGFFFFVSRTHVQHSASYSDNFGMNASEIHDRVARQQAELERKQAELERHAGELTSELQHRIENMEIHRLMDLVDAPRIILPIPTPATIAQWAQLATAAEQQSGEAASGEAASGEAASGEAASGEAALAAGTNEDTIPPEAEVQAEADAAVQLIAAEGEAALAAGNSPEAVVAISGSDNSPRRSSSRSVEPERSASPTKSKESRPSWVRQVPKRVGNVRRDVIVTDEYATSEECEWAADRLLQLETYEHLQRLVGKPIDADQAHRMRDDALRIEGQAPWFHTELEKAGITIDYIHHEIARDEYLEEVERSFGKMLKLYTEIEFTPAVDNELRQRWQASQRQERFALVGFGASSMLGLLGLAWGLLKVDTWTKGYYTKRLFIGVPLGILGLFGLLVLFMETIGGH
jgi:hypothetical protein